MEVERFFSALGLTVLWSLVAIAIATLLFEVLERRYHLMREITQDNNTGAGVLAGCFVLGIFYVVGQIITN
ncbi:MAG: DUF350 domain-containing protein [Chloroflexota bacterium]|nr:MAG: DUF350 domain-containing protein [Chloroflexota bacterium]